MFDLFFRVLVSLSAFSAFIVREVAMFPNLHWMCFCRSACIVSLFLLRILNHHVFGAHFDLPSPRSSFRVYMNIHIYMYVCMWCVCFLILFQFCSLCMPLGFLDVTWFVIVFVFDVLHGLCMWFRIC